MGFGFHLGGFIDIDWRHALALESGVDIGLTEVWKVKAIKDGGRVTYTLLSVGLQIRRS